MKLIAVLIMSTFAVSAFSFDGAKYFKKNCKSCHSIGGGDVVGPDLAELSKRRKLDWIVKFVNYPEGMINGDDEEKGYEKPDALAKKVYDLYKPTVMTEIEISKEDMKKLLVYIDSLGKKAKGKILKIK